LQVHAVTGKRCQTKMAEVGDSVLLDDFVIDVEKKQIRNVIGKGTRILNSDGLLEERQRPAVGENMMIEHRMDGGTTQ